MCGIAGIVDLADRRPVPRARVQAMADALVHRGPDEQGFLERPGLALASRRLSVVGLADGQQPIGNESRDAWVVFNGELFDHLEKREELESRGHRFSTRCDTEIIPHLWEEHRERLFEHLHGQFAFALWDEKLRLLIVARDRFGICPLYWTVQGDWMLFASEVKGLLASGMVDARVDLRGINHVFTFFAMPGPVTCFEGVHSLLPGHYLEVALGPGGTPAKVQDRKYWEMDFPDAGDEAPESDPKRLVDEFEHFLVGAVRRRLRADVPVVAYLSGGVDSSTVVALASRALGSPIPTFTIRIEDPALDETREAAVVARHLGCEQTEVGCGAQDVLRTYPSLIRAAESPVIDTSCSALLLLAEEVHRRGYKVALTGEGADEWLAGYPWYKTDRLLRLLDVVPRLRLSQFLRRAYLRLSGFPVVPRSMVDRIHRAVAGHNPWLDIYGLMSLSKLHFFGPALREVIVGNLPYADLELNLERARRWHPLNRAVYFGARVHLPGLLLHAKGDRVAMHSSVETRYPFLDDDVFSFLSKIHPRWKMSSSQDKVLLRLLAQRYLPRNVVRRPKLMFRAPLDSFHRGQTLPFVRQLLSSESIRRTGYFDAAAVAHWQKGYRRLRPGSLHRVCVELGLVGVLATQLWHHTFLDPNLADIPGHSARATA